MPGGRPALSSGSCLLRHKLNCRWSGQLLPPWLSMDLNIQRHPIHMPRLLRRTIAAALASLLLAIPAAAQDAATNGTVGAPELRGFRLPGTRVVPAPTTTQPATPPPAQPAAREPARQAPAPAVRTAAPPQPQRETPRAAAPATAGTPAGRSPIATAPAAAPAADTAAGEPPPISLDAFPTAPTYPTQDYSGAAAPVDVVPAEADDEPLAFGNMMWPALAAGLALLAGLFFMQKRRRAALA